MNVAHLKFKGNDLFCVFCIIRKHVLTKKNASILATMCFNQLEPFSNSPKISLKNVLTKFHEDWTINVTFRFHDDQRINVASRVLTRKNAPPPGGHVFQQNRSIF
ncbi:hypothetical protein DPMN_074626 [Dreissena polymorpha]|uniref:Uncharacterized protein n=1 Tax=Dreissena polymorpha TaxID=45954 RepID=A0A9D3YGM3_DREPO|nr:hypothetical protein DPMN_074626 [Dreissena polymorpha]